MREQRLLVRRHVECLEGLQAMCGPRSRVRHPCIPLPKGTALTVCCSYYEWQKKSPTTKIAHFTRLPFATKDTNAKSAPYPLLFFAGLYDVVTYASPVESRFKPSDDPEDTREPYPTGNPVPLATYTILTTAPANDLAWLHDRMPCMLEGWEEVRRWLDLGEVKGWEEGRGGTGELLRGKPGLEWCVQPVLNDTGLNGTATPCHRRWEKSAQIRRLT